MKGLHQDHIVGPLTPKFVTGQDCDQNNRLLARICLDDARFFVHVCARCKWNPCSKIRECQFPPVFFKTPRKGRTITVTLFGSGNGSFPHLKLVNGEGQGRRGSPAVALLVPWPLPPCSCHPSLFVHGRAIKGVDSQEMLACRGNPSELSGSFRSPSGRFPDVFLTSFPRTSLFPTLSLRTAFFRAVFRGRPARLRQTGHGRDMGVPWT